VTIVEAGTMVLYLNWNLTKEDYKITVFGRKSKVGERPYFFLISEQLKDFISLEKSMVIISHEQKCGWTI